MTGSLEGGGGGFEEEEVGRGGGRVGVGVVEVLELVDVLLEGMGSEGTPELGAGGVGGLLGGPGGISVEVEVGTGSRVEVLCKDQANPNGRPQQLERLTYQDHMRW